MAFLNTSGGTIYIGVSDNGRINPISDCKHRDMLSNLISSWIQEAFFHQPYNLIRSNIKIEFYDDKLVVSNPGGLYHLTLDEAKSGIQTFRNPGLVRILDRLGYIENYGKGIKRTIEAYKGYKQCPSFISLKTSSLLLYLT